MVIQVIFQIIQPFAEVVIHKITIIIDWYLCITMCKICVKFWVQVMIHIGNIGLIKNKLYVSKKKTSSFEHFLYYEINFGKKVTMCRDIPFD